MENELEEDIFRKKVVNTITLSKEKISSLKIVFIKVLCASFVLFFLFVSAGNPNNSTIT